MNTTVSTRHDLAITLDGTLQHLATTLDTIDTASEKADCQKVTTDANDMGQIITDSVKSFKIYNSFPDFGDESSVFLSAYLIQLLDATTLVCALNAHHTSIQISACIPKGTSLPMLQVNSATTSTIDSTQNEAYFQEIGPFSPVLLEIPWLTQPFPSCPLVVLPPLDHPRAHPLPP